jgi:GntR family transcriptional regulator/MocR family aminotransferase
LLEQNVTAAFMAGGHFARHVKRMRGLYRRRRAALAEALSGSFRIETSTGEMAAGGTVGERATVEMAAGGMHLLLRLPRGVDDGDAARRALAAGLAPTALSGLAIAHDSGQALLLGFTNVREEDAPALVARLAAAVGV